MGSDMKKVANVSREVESAADALRLHEMKGRITLPWDKIAASQRRKWIEKAVVVLKAAGHLA